MNNLELYRIFYHTARAGNFTKAADALHVTQPSVSYAVKQLEEALGAKLFHRLSKGVTLTREGEALLDYVRQSFAALEAGEAQLAALKRLEAGELRIGASDSIVKSLLLPHLRAFRKRYPQVRLRLSHGRTADIARRLRDGQIDCGFIHLPVEDGGLEIRPFAIIQDAFVAGEPYRELAKRPIAASELLGLPLLFMSAGSSTRSFAEGWFAAQGLAADADIELGSIDLLVEFARLGFGVAYMNRSFAVRELERGELFELRTERAIPPREIGLAVKRDAALPLTAQRFVEMLSASIAPDPAAD